MVVVDPVVALKNAPLARWSLLGYGSEGDYAMLLASNLHAQGLRVITDIDHIDWGLLPYEMFGFKFVDIHIQSKSRLGDDKIADQFIVEAQVRQTMAQPAVCLNMVIDGVQSKHRLRTSRQQPVNEIPVESEKGALVIGSTEKMFEKPPSVARLAFEKKLQKTLGSNAKEGF